HPPAAEPLRIDELEYEPLPDDDDGGQVKEHTEDEDRHQAEYLRSRIEPDIRAHQPGYRAARADRWDRGTRIADDVQRRRAEAAEQVEQDKTPLAQHVLDIVAEDPQVEHVPTDMEPVGVQEHGREDGQPGGLYLYGKVDVGAALPGHQSRNHRIAQR